MKSTYLLCALLFFITSCDRVDPEVSTQYIKEGNREKQRDIAFITLLNHYQASAKDKQFYEVISKRDGRFILNYNRLDERLTLCLDPGSGWGRQFINISENDLEDFVAKDFSLLDFDMGKAIAIDSVTIILKGKELKIARESIRPKTNGSPTINNY